MCGTTVSISTVDIDPSLSYRLMVTRKAEQQQLHQQQMELSIKLTQSDWTKILQEVNLLDSFDRDNPRPVLNPRARLNTYFSDFLSKKMQEEGQGRVRCWLKWKDNWFLTRTRLSDPFWRGECLR